MARYRKGLYGWGINDADYEIKRYNEDGSKFICPFYNTWRSMVKRGACPKYKEKFPAYKDVGISEDWRYFMDFRAWMEQQDWQGKCLDKDLLSGDRKEYSPNTCCFISHRVNIFISERMNPDFKFEKGTWYDKNRGKWRSQGVYYDQSVNKAKHLGYYLTQQEAHEAWRSYKEYCANKLARDELEGIAFDALVKRYSFGVWYDDQHSPDFMFLFEDNSFSKILLK